MVDTSPIAVAKTASYMKGITMDDQSKLLDQTASIVTAYVTKNPLPAADLAGFIRSVHTSLSGLAGSVQFEEPEAKTPAVSIKKSIGPDYIICLEDGKKFKSLKRHLRTTYNMSPEDYRAKWNLPRDYPMVAPAYSAARSQLAKQMGLGARPKAAPARRGRKPAAG